MNGVMAFPAEISQMHISQLTGALAKTKVFHEVLKLPINDHSKYLIKVVILASSPARFSMPGVLGKSWKRMFSMEMKYFSFPYRGLKMPKESELTQGWKKDVFLSIAFSEIFIKW
ncbi:hypothetical protein TNCT_369911 [Trichonephila clavata]|uniref:Uncharacterized protein n=1 Tax=Trichonephila clavata TaxID=2740835 RepID=A0A8X6IRS6_TRICU|nr:hypothetical protein TNCT_369911 [Trichonephila clavata]